MPDNSPGNNSNTGSHKLRVLVAAFLFAVVVIAGAGGGLWYWLNRSLPDHVVVAENAIFDGKLVAVGLVDLEKIIALDRYWFGNMDPAAVPIAEEKKELLQELFSGPLNLKDNLKHVLLSLHLVPDSNKTSTVMVLPGSFDSKLFMKAIGTSFKTDQEGEGRWSITKKVIVKAKGDSTCKKPEPKKTKKPRKFYIQFSSDWVMIFENEPHGNALWNRLLSQAEKEQDFKMWQDYRKGKIASFVAINPLDASKGIGGIQGMIAAGAAKQAPQVKSLAAGVEMAPLEAALKTNIRLTSHDATWNNKTKAEIDNKLDEAVKNSNAYSPTLAGLFSNISVASGNEALDIDINLDSKLLDNMGKVVQEAIASMFTVSMSSSDQDDKVQKERINKKPNKYKNWDLAKLPRFKKDQHQLQPLLIKGPFAFNLGSIKKDKKGLFELDLKGEIGLPKEMASNSNGAYELSLTVSSVQNAKGEELLRDETCLERKDVSGRSLNHEPEKSSFFSFGGGSANKKVRFKSGMKISEMARITGKIKFSSPVGVRRFELPMKVGSVVEHAGLRFYLNGIKKGSVSYQVSGDIEKLVEVRGLNKKGQVLDTSWSMSSTGTSGKRTSQGYQGEVHGLAVFIAKGISQVEKNYALTEFFPVKESKGDRKPPTWRYAPEKIDVESWQEFAGLDFSTLEINPKRDWQVWGGKINQIAEINRPPLRIFFSHTPKQWNKDPMAHVYHPAIPELAGVLSALSYRVDEPAVKRGVPVRFEDIQYPYATDSGQIAIKRSIKGKLIDTTNFSLDSGLEGGKKLQQLKGEIIFRLPKSTRSTQINLGDLWSGVTVDGVTVTLKQLSGGVFPGYSVEVGGDIEKLVNLHGILPDSKRILASPAQHQAGGYWSMTFPFKQGIEKLELITATEQEVFRFPFDITPKYPANPKKSAQNAGKN